MTFERKIPKWKLILGFGFFLGTPTLIGLLIALHLTDHGGPILPAAMIGAAIAVSLFYLAYGYFVVLRNRVCSRRNGYPFRKGDMVEVIRGKHVGRRGRVVCWEQDYWTYQVEWQGVGVVEREWLAASKLRRIGHCARPIISLRELPPFVFVRMLKQHRRGEPAAFSRLTCWLGLILCVVLLMTIASAVVQLLAFLLQS